MDEDLKYETTLESIVTSQFQLEHKLITDGEETEYKLILIPLFMQNAAVTHDIHGQMTFRELSRLLPILTATWWAGYLKAKRMARVKINDAFNSSWHE